MKIAILLVSLSVSFNVNAQNEHSRFGIGAYKSGKFLLAEPFLKTALESKNLTDEERKITLDTLAKVYWETGKDHKLLNVIKGKISKDDEQRWWCRILSRRGHTNKAKSCWSAIGDITKTLELIRMRALLDTLVNPGAKFAYRPNSSQAQ